MNYARHVLTGSIYFFAGSVIAAFIAYLTKLYLVRNLSVEDYGLFFAVFTFVLLFRVFRSLGLSSGLVRFIAEYNTKNRQNEIKSLITGAFASQLIVSAVFVIIMWGISDYLSIHYFKDERASMLLKILSLYLPLSTVEINFSSIFQGFKKKIFALCQPVTNASVLLLIIVGFSLGLGLYSPALGYLAGIVLFFIVFIIPILRTHNYFKYSHKNFSRLNKQLLSFSTPLMLTSIGIVLLTYFDTLMLTHFDTLTVVGVYNILYPTAFLVVLIGTSLAAILLPVITEFWTLGKKKLICNYYSLINKYLFVLSLPLIIALMLFSQDIIEIMFGETYLVGLLTFNILLLGTLPGIFMKINTQILVSIKQPRKVMLIYVYGALLNIILNSFLIPHHSMEGAAIASVTSFIFMLIMSLIYIKKRLAISLPWKSWSIILICSSLLGIFPILFLQLPIHTYIATSIGLVFGGVLYLLALYKLGVVQMKELTSLMPNKKL